MRCRAYKAVWYDMTIRSTAIEVMALYTLGASLCQDINTVFAYMPILAYQIR